MNASLNRKTVENCSGGSHSGWSAVKKTRQPVRGAAVTKGRTGLCDTTRSFFAPNGIQFNPWKLFILSGNRRPFKDTSINKQAPISTVLYTLASTPRLNQ